MHLLLEAAVLCEGHIYDPLHLGVLCTVVGPFLLPVFGVRTGVSWVIILLDLEPGSSPTKSFPSPKIPGCHLLPINPVCACDFQNFIKPLVAESRTLILKSSPYPPAISSSIYFIKVTSTSS